MTSSQRTIKVNIFVSDLDQAVPTGLTVEQYVSRVKGVDCVELSTFITKAMALYELDPAFDIQVEYWSNMCQTFVACNYLSAFEERENLINVDEMSISLAGNSCLTLRFKNCTGNVIDLSEEKKNVEVSDIELHNSSIALSVDSQYKHQRTRKISQAIDMVTRWRAISQGYYDYQIKRHVWPMTLEQSALNLDIRHRLVTGVDQHIEKKTLDDYYGYIRKGNDPIYAYDFKSNRDEYMKALRSFCISKKEDIVASCQKPS